MRAIMGLSFAGFGSTELSADRFDVVPDGLPDDSTVAHLEQPDCAVADPAAVPIQVEGPSDQAARPDVLIEDEIRPVQPANGNVPFMDRGRQDVVVATPDGRQAVDR